VTRLWAQDQRNGPPQGRNVSTMNLETNLIQAIRCSRVITVLERLRGLNSLVDDRRIGTSRSRRYSFDVSPDISRTTATLPERLATGLQTARNQVTPRSVPWLPVMVAIVSILYIGTRKVANGTRRYVETTGPPSDAIAPMRRQSTCDAAISSRPMFAQVKSLFTVE
jgi:hypothetical protein